MSIFLIQLINSLIFHLIKSHGSMDLLIVFIKNIENTYFKGCLRMSISTILDKDLFYS